MNRITWALIVLPCAAVAGLTILDWFFPKPHRLPPAPALSFPVASPGPIEVELQHTNGKFTFRLGGSGYPIIADPTTGRRWIMLSVKED